MQAVPSKRHQSSPGSFLRAAMAPKAQACRTRFKGSIDCLAEAIQPHVTGMHWLQYDETSKGAKVQAEELKTLKPVVSSLKALQNNLSFTQSDMKAVAKKIHDAIGASWKLSDDEQLDWADAIAKRVKVACRHVAQAHVKSPTTPRLQSIRDEAITVSDSPDYFYGYDVEAQCAWRQAPGGQRMLSQDLLKPEGLLVIIRCCASSLMAQLMKFATLQLLSSKPRRRPLTRRARLQRDAVRLLSGRRRTSRAVSRSRCACRRAAKCP